MQGCSPSGAPRHRRKANADVVRHHGVAFASWIAMNIRCDVDCVSPTTIRLPRRPGGAASLHSPARLSRDQQHPRSNVRSDGRHPRANARSDVRHPRHQRAFRRPTPTFQRAFRRPTPTSSTRDPTADTHASTRDRTANTYASTCDPTSDTLVLGVRHARAARTRSGPRVWRELSAAWRCRPRSSTSSSRRGTRWTWPRGGW